MRYSEKTRRGPTVETVDTTIEHTKQTAKEIVEATIKNTDERFDSLTKHTVIKSAAVMNHQNWPDRDVLKDYGDTDILNLFNAFQEPLKAD